jgi:hypothetical protein
LHEINIQETNIIPFTRETISNHFDHDLGKAVITRTDCVKDLGLWLDNKLYLHHHVNYIFSVASNLLGLIKFIMYNVSSLDSLLVLYISLVRSKLEYASIAWNNLTTTDSNKLQSIQKKFAHLCYRRYYQSEFPCNYDVILETLGSSTLHSRPSHLDDLFLIIVFNNAIDCQYIMDTVSLRVPYKLISDSSIFSVSKALRTSPSATYSTVVNIIYQFLVVFSTTTISLDDLLCYAI